MLTLETSGLFTWGFGNKYHVETAIGNYEYSCADYPGGNNTIVPCGTYSEWLKKNNMEFGRDKGWHKIKDYCGTNVIIKE